MVEYSLRNHVHDMNAEYKVMLIDYVTLYHSRFIHMTNHTAPIHPHHDTETPNKDTDKTTSASLDESYPQGT